MTKQEILDAINSTIIANGQKGITAESLNNILNEMVNATPEGSSTDAGLKFYATDFVPTDMFTREFANTLIGTEDEALGLLLIEMLDNNAAVYAEIMKIVNDAMDISETDVHPFSLPSITIEKPYEFLVLEMGTSTPGIVTVINDIIVIKPSDWGETGYFLNVASGYMLNEDGSYSMLDPRILFVKGEEDIVLPEYLMEHNLNAYEIIASGAFNINNVKVAVVSSDVLGTIQELSFNISLLKSTLSADYALHNLFAMDMEANIIISNTLGLFKSVGFGVPTPIQLFA